MKYQFNTSLNYSYSPEFSCIVYYCCDLYTNGALVAIKKKDWTSNGFTNKLEHYISDKTTKGTNRKHI